MDINIGKRIKEYRIHKGLTVNKLANLAGISQSYLRDIELGNKQPTVEYLSYICDALGITLCDFFHNENTGNELSQMINNLNLSQRKALIEFIKTIK